MCPRNWVCVPMPTICTTWEFPQSVNMAIRLSIRIYAASTSVFCGLPKLLPWNIELLLFLMLHFCVDYSTPCFLQAESHLLCPFEFLYRTFTLSPNVPTILRKKSKTVAFFFLYNLFNYFILICFFQYHISWFSQCIDNMMSCWTEGFRMETKVLQVRAWVSCKQWVSGVTFYKSWKVTSVFWACSRVSNQNLQAVTKARCRTGLWVLGRASAAIVENEELDG